MAQVFSQRFCFYIYQLSSTSIENPAQMKNAQNTLETSIKEIGPFFIADGVRSSNNIEPWWYHVPNQRRCCYMFVFEQLEIVILKP